MQEQGRVWSNHVLPQFDWSHNCWPDRFPHSCKVRNHTKTPSWMLGCPYPCARVFAVSYMWYVPFFFQVCHMTIVDSIRPSGVAILIKCLILLAKMLFLTKKYWYFFLISPKKHNYCVCFQNSDSPVWSNSAHPHQSVPKQLGGKMV